MSEKKKILVVDDSKTILMLMTSVINGFRPKLEVITCDDSDEAIAIAGREAIDYFCFDLNMPKRNGFELVEEMRKSYPEQQYAIFTANIQDATFEKAKAMGVQCVSKPVTSDSVKLMLESMDA